MKIAVIGIKQIVNKPKIHELNFQELYNKIADRGHQVDIYSQSKRKHISCFSARYSRKIRIITLIGGSKNPIFFLLNYLFNNVWAAFSNYDVIHIYGVLPACFAGIPRLFSSAKIVISCNHLDHQPNSLGKFGTTIGNWLEKIAINNAHELIVNSKALENYFRQKHSTTPSYIPYAPSLHSTKEHQLNYGEILGLESQKYLLYLDKLEPKQKPDLLIKAFQSIKPFGWKLVLIGELGDFPHYASSLLNIAQQNDIIFVNDTRGYSLSKIIRQAGLLVVPSDKVNLKFPGVLLEAMEVGLPVLASDIAVHQEVIGKNRGLLFEANNQESLTTQLQYVLGQSMPVLRMAENARTYVAIHHNWDRVIYKHLFLYLKPVHSGSKQHSSYRTLP